MIGKKAKKQIYFCDKITVINDSKNLRKSPVIMLRYWVIFYRPFLNLHLPMSDPESNDTF